MNYLFKNEVIDYDFFDKKFKDTILFLHGWGGNKFSFFQTINLLKSKFNILTITMPSIEPTTSTWTMFDYKNLIENLLHIHNLKKVIIICHSFGFRITSLLNKKIEISKLIVTGGAGIKKRNIFIKMIKNNNKILINNEKFKHFYKFIASKDYLNLSKTNKETFKNIVNLDLSFALSFNCEILLFWGKQDYETPLWIAKKIKKKNNAKLILTNGDHFAYLTNISLFNNSVKKFLDA